MARPLRIEFPGALYHITARGNEKNKIFFQKSDMNDFLNILCRVTKRYHLILHSYCLMHNHYHLLVETPEGNLSRGMRQLNGVYTQHINNKYKRVGHLLQGRYKSILVDKENYLVQLSSYIALNPVRAKLVTDPKDWLWSSYAQCIGFKKGIHCLFTDGILAQFGSKRKVAMKAYQEYVFLDIGAESPLKQVKGQILLGSEDFISKMDQRIKQKEKLSEIPRSQLYASRPTLDKIFQGKDKKELKIYRASLAYGYTLKKIAEFLGVHYTTVSKIIKKFENETQK